MRGLGAMLSRLFVAAVTLFTQKGPRKHAARDGQACFRGPPCLLRLFGLPGPRKHGTQAPYRSWSSTLITAAGGLIVCASALTCREKRIEPGRAGDSMEGRAAET